VSRRRDRQGLAVAAVAGLALAAVVHVHARPLPAPAVHSAPGGNAALGQQMAAARGWTGPQWDCLYALWERESGWSNTAENASDAYGIAQALGHGPTNQYPAGPANPPTSSPAAQIRWGLGYIAGTYGTPCSAWTHETADGWY
jgi:resuscitation-promoting factor RpfB